MKYKQINIKEDLPTVALALAMIEIEIETCKLEGIQVLKIVHGYGSHGIGGEIKKALKHWLLLKKRSHFIQNYVFGEMWTTSSLAERIKQQCPEVLADSDLYVSNPGITIIVL